MPLMFERQPRETSKAFAAFSAYLGMGPERSLAAVGKKLGKSKVMMEKWSRRFDWPARVVAHGGHLHVLVLQPSPHVTAARTANSDTAQNDLLAWGRSAASAQHTGRHEVW